MFRENPQEFEMANVAVIGAQWGDEGKGKIVDWLSERAEVVVRFQGGHNAGHTLVIGNQTYKLALLPSGVVRPGKLSIIGNGVVVDPWHFLEEVKKVTEQGLSGVQAARARKRWAGHVAESTTKPWLAMGISRRTYYRRKAEGKPRRDDD